MVQKGEHMKRILVFGMTENPGGVESFLMNYYRNIDKNKIQFDFLCNTYHQVVCEDEILSLGGRVFHISMRRQHPIKFYRELKAFFENHATDYQAIWINVNSLANIDYLKYAKQYGIPQRIIHSHNSQNMDSKLRGILHKFNKSRIEKYATDYWACSAKAADWFYNETLADKVIIIRNAIDSEKYLFDETKREKIRKQYHLENKRVIGNIGRLHFQKNQSFAIDVFSKYHELDPESVLVLIGQGEDMALLKEKAKSLGLTKDILFVGVQSDIGGWLSSLDLFLFTSLFEGLSIVAVEAQANGVPIIASKEALNDESAINSNALVLDLSSKPEDWAEQIVLNINVDNRLSREECLRAIHNNGFDVAENTRRLESLLAG